MYEYIHSTNLWKNSIRWTCILLSLSEKLVTMTSDVVWRNYLWWPRSVIFLSQHKHAKSPPSQSLPVPSHTPAHPPNTKQYWYETNNLSHKHRIPFQSPCWCPRGTLIFFFIRRLWSSIYRSLQKYQVFQAPPKNTWTFTNPKWYAPFCTLTFWKHPKMHKMPR